MNLYFVRGSGRDAKIVTPSLTGSLLPGITRDSLLTLAADLGYEAEEARSPSTTGATATPTAPSPRSSPAAPPP